MLYANAECGSSIVSPDSIVKIISSITYSSNPHKPYALAPIESTTIASSSKATNGCSFWLDPPFPGSS
jgi:hypothetical protein